MQYRAVQYFEEYTGWLDSRLHHKGAEYEILAKCLGTSSYQFQDETELLVWMEQELRFLADQAKGAQKRGENSAAKSKRTEARKLQGALQPYHPKLPKYPELWVRWDAKK